MVRQFEAVSPVLLWSLWAFVVSDHVRDTALFYTLPQVMRATPLGTSFAWNLQKWLSSTPLAGL